MRTMLIAAVVLAACRDDRPAPARRAPGCADCVVHERSLPAIRGNILDRNGVPLAQNRPANDVLVTPRTFDAAARDAMIAALALDATETAEVDMIVARGKKADPRRAIVVLYDVTPERALQAGTLAGVEVRAGPARDYPGALAPHVVGLMSPMNEAEIDRLAPMGYKIDDRLGRSGVEKTWETYLRGKVGRQRYLVDAAGNAVEDTDLIEPVPGENVVLTIDARLQRLAQDAVASQSAAAVAILEVDTGKIRALVSTPAFDPASRLGRADPKMNDPRLPFLDKNLQWTYAPDATYGFVTAIAALEDGVTGADDQLACSGAHEVGTTSFTCGARHGKLDLARALAVGCDVHLWQLAERVGLDRMSEVARRFGFGAATGVGLGGEDEGDVPTQASYANLGGHKLGHTLNAAVGSGDVEVTPLQLVTAYAALASGTRHVPQVVERVETTNGRVVVAYDPKVSPSVTATPVILDELRGAMTEAVQDGAAAGARSAIVQIAGQVGTAEVRARLRKPTDPFPGWDPTASHAWFAGWAPAGAPEIAIVVLIPHGGDGAKVAAPIARTIVEGWWQTVR